MVGYVFYMFEDSSIVWGFLKESIVSVRFLRTLRMGYSMACIFKGTR